MTPVGLPHSGIHGSKPAYDSPWHFAVNRALHRLLAPRHPPYALSSLTYYRYFYVYSKLPFRSEFFRLLLDFFLYAVFKEHGCSGCHRSQGWREVTKEQDALSVAEDKTRTERSRLVHRHDSNKDV